MIHRQRNWISREEIAEIHDSRAQKLETKSVQTGTDIYNAQRARIVAAEVRAIERLSNPVGARVA